MPDERMRLRAAKGLAAAIVEQLGREDPADRGDQLQLPI
jgi:hypothetical protein